MAWSCFADYYRFVFVNPIEFLGICITLPNSKRLSSGFGKCSHHLRFLRLLLSAIVPLVPRFFDPVNLCQTFLFIWWFWRIRRHFLGCLPNRGQPFEFLHGNQIVSLICLGGNKCPICAILTMWVTHSFPPRLAKKSGSPTQKMAFDLIWKNIHFAYEVVVCH